MARSPLTPTTRRSPSRARRCEVAHVPDVEQVEHAVREHDRPRRPRATPRCGHRRLERSDLSSPAARSRAHARRQRRAQLGGAHRARRRAGSPPRCRRRWRSPPPRAATRRPRAPASPPTTTASPAPVTSTASSPPHAASARRLAPTPQREPVAPARHDAGVATRIRCAGTRGGARRSRSPAIVQPARRPRPRPRSASPASTPR